MSVEPDAAAPAPRPKAGSDAAVPGADAGGDAGAGVDAGADERDPKSKSGSRLARLVYRGGGAEVFATFVDTARDDTPCSFQLAEDGVERCLPAEHGSVRYAESSCATPLHVASAGTGAFGVLQSTACATLLEVWSLGAVQGEVTAVWALDGQGECVSAGVLGAGAQARALLDKLSAATSVGASRAHAGATRLRESRLLAEDGAELADAVWDATFASHCALNTAADGALRCLPEWQATGGFGKGSTCTPELARSHDACGATPRFAANSVSAGPRNGWEIYAVTATTYDGPVFQDIGDSCISFTGPGPFLQASRVAPAELAEASRVHVGAGRIQRAAYRSAEGDVLAALGELQRGLPDERLFDSELGTSCQLEATDGKARCLPSDLSGSIDYADAGCTVPVVLGLGVGEHRYMRENHAGSVPSFRRIGTATSLSDAYSRVEGLCTLVQHFEPAIPALALGDEIPLDTFQVFEAATALSPTDG